MNQNNPEAVTIIQSVAILIDGNNIERSIHEETNDPHTMLNFDTLIPRLLDNRGLNRLIYFREGTGQNDASLNNGGLTFDQPMETEKPDSFIYDPEDPVFSNGIC